MYPTFILLESGNLGNMEKLKVEHMESEAWNLKNGNWEMEFENLRFGNLKIDN